MYSLRTTLSVLLNALTEYFNLEKKKKKVKYPNGIGMVIRSYAFYILVCLVSNRFEEPLANLLNEQHRTVKEQLEQLRMKKSSIKPPQEIEKSKPHNEKPLQSLVLDCTQRKRLQQQMQQVIKYYQYYIRAMEYSLYAAASWERGKPVVQQALWLAVLF